jgi:hypothetical protein
MKDVSYECKILMPYLDVTHPMRNCEDFDTMGKFSIMCSMCYLRSVKMIIFLIFFSNSSLIIGEEKINSFRPVYCFPTPLSFSPPYYRIILLKCRSLSSALSCSPSQEIETQMSHSEEKES